MRSWLLSAFSFNTSFFLHGLVVHLYWVHQQVKESFCSFWPEWLLAPGTLTSSTATPSAGRNQDKAHLHDNLDNCYTGELWLHVKILLTDNSLCLHSVCFHPNCTCTFFFQPRSTFPTEELPFNIKLLMRKCVTCNHKPYLIPHKVNAHRGSLRLEEEHTFFCSTVRVWNYFYNFNPYLSVSTFSIIPIFSRL